MEDIYPTGVLTNFQEGTYFNSAFDEPLKGANIIVMDILIASKSVQCSI